MNDSTAAQAYKQAAIENAPPIKIVRLLYDGAIRYMNLALRGDPKDPKSDFVNAIDQADAVVTELRLALDHKVGTDVSHQLEKLYLFCELRLGQALSDRSHEPVTEVVRVMTTLREAWIDIEVDQVDR